MDTICSGKRNCEVPTSSLITKGFHPCPVDVMSYLEASYQCMSGKQLQTEKQSLIIGNFRIYTFAAQKHITFFL